jgi:hypothetical protein
MNIQEATRSYEAWMRECTTVVAADVRAKHEQMKKDVFLFFRGTYYRWAQMWPDVCPELSQAPKVLACGDLHVGSFGTWRDAEGRLSWGVDDFDEACRLAYTNDLVRPAASVKIVIDCEQLEIKLKRGCEAILKGYELGIRKGGWPFVLAEREKNLQKLGIEAIKPSEDFWEKLCGLPRISERLAPDLKKAFEASLPPRLKYQVLRREAGMGSRGQQRFVALAEWEGGYIAREAKALVPSSCTWVKGELGSGQGNYELAIARAVRSRDPFQQVMGRWLIRRLSPDSNPIEITDLPRDRDEEILLQAMGTEAANVHSGNKNSVKSILKDLGKRKPNWLRSAAKDMAKAMEHDWKKFGRL